MNLAAYLAWNAAIFFIVAIIVIVGHGLAHNWGYAASGVALGAAHLWFSIYAIRIERRPSPPVA